MVNEQNMELIKTACEGNIEQVKAFIKKNTVQMTDNNGNTLAHWVAFTGNVELLNFLKEQGIDLNAQNNFGEQAIHMAAKGNKVQAAAYLKEQGVDVNAQDKSGESPLHAATRKENVEMIHWLCENGGNVNIKDKELRTPVFFAAMNGHIPSMNELVKQGADVNIKEFTNNTPASVAAENGHLEMLQWLSENGADMKAPCGINNGSILHVAALCSENDGKMIDFLVNKCGLSVNAGDRYGLTPLMRASQRGNYDVVQKLLDLGANVNVGDCDGQSALTFAACCGENQIAELLLKSGARPNVGDKEGWTPAHYAAHARQESTLKLLRKYGADLDQRTQMHWQSPAFALPEIPLPGPSAKTMYEKHTGKELPVKEWEEEEKRNQLYRHTTGKETKTTAAFQKGDVAEALRERGTNISSESAKPIAYNDTSNTI